jgi:hypothetical protein
MRVLVVLMRAAKEPSFLWKPQADGSGAIAGEDKVAGKPDGMVKRA